MGDEGVTFWCCFCGGPFKDALHGWKDIVAKYWEIEIPQVSSLSLDPYPTPPSESDAVTIFDEGKDCWSEFVCVGPVRDSYVSRRRLINDNPRLTYPSAHLRKNNQPYLIFHPGCLSFLCRRINVSPKQVWSELYAGDPNYYHRHDRAVTGLLGHLRYHNIDLLHVEICDSRRLAAAEKEKKKLQWLLARPNTFPVVPSLAASVAFVTSSPTFQSSVMNIFNVPELFDIILDYIIGQDIPEAELADELKADEIFTPHSIIEGTKDVFTLLQVNREFYTAIVRDRQNIFLRLAWMHGWMLPITPEDWNIWPNGSLHKGNMFTMEDDKDWRAYLLKFLRKENVNIRNRWRFEKMAMQFARGQPKAIWSWECHLWLPVGELVFRPELKYPEPWVWEFAGME